MTKRTRKERRRKPMSKREVVLWTANGILLLSLVVICAVIIMILTKPTAATPIDDKVAAEPVKTEEQQVVSTMKEEAIAETKAATEAEVAETKEEVEEVTEVTEEEVKEEEYAYSNNLTDDDITSVLAYFSNSVDVDEEQYFDFISEYKEYLDYDLDAEGYLLIPLSEESLRQTDDERPNASVEMGLNKNPINDAVAFPFALNEEQIKKILAAKIGQKIDFTEDEIKALRIELFTELAENPILFEAWMKLISDQKIGQDAKIIESWPAGKRYLELNEIARDLEPYDGLDPYADIRGKGMNIWLRKLDGETYTNPEYQKYVLDVVLLLLPAKTDVEVLTAKAGDHYNLIPGEINSMRFAQPANYKESLASLVFKIYTKDGKVAIKFGANLRDKRPEVLNYTVTRKPVQQSKPKPQQQPQPQPQPQPQDPNNPNPSPTPTPETKNPNEDPAAQGNAPIGGGINDDPGPGPWKPDQGNSKSDKVEESQYQQGNSVNTDGADPNQYPTGPAADNTDNGQVPDTSAPSNQIGIGDGVNNNSYTDIATGQQTDGGNNHGAISAPPVD